MSDKTTGVRFGNEYKSTMFTICCGTAVEDESCCPGCGAVVLPEGRKARFQSAFPPWQYKKAPPKRGL